MSATNECWYKSLVHCPWKAIKFCPKITGHHNNNDILPHVPRLTILGRILSRTQFIAILCNHNFVISVTNFTASKWHPPLIISTLHNITFHARYIPCILHYIPGARLHVLYIGLLHVSNRSYQPEKSYPLQLPLNQPTYKLALK